MEGRRGVFQRRIAKSASLLSSLELSHVLQYAPSFSLSAPCILLTLTRRLRVISNAYFDTPPEAKPALAAKQQQYAPSFSLSAPYILLTLTHRLRFISNSYFDTPPEAKPALAAEQQQVRSFVLALSALHLTHPDTPPESDFKCLFDTPSSSIAQPKPEIAPDEQTKS